jgi:hypothetical protein
MTTLTLYLKFETADQRFQCNMCGSKADWQGNISIGGREIVFSGDSVFACIEKLGKELDTVGTIESVWCDDERNAIYCTILETHLLINKSTRLLDIGNWPTPI